MSYRYALLGASRGLGQALYQDLKRNQIQSEFFLVSRKIDLPSESTYKCDFSSVPVDLVFLQKLKEFNPTHIVYCAGGGPYGFFQDKKWSDHLWALNVNFLFPAQLLHAVSDQANEFSNLKNITFIGSRIAESSPDRQASSYAAAKHALRGLVTTVQKEATLPFKVKLFSPGYILTDLLPANSAPRLENKAESAAHVASQLAQFIASDAELG